MWEGILHKSFKEYIKGIFIKYVMNIDTGKSNMNGFSCVNVFSVKGF